MFRALELVDFEPSLEARGLSDVVKQALKEVDKALGVELQDCH